MTQVATPERYWERFSRLKRERGLSWSQLVRASDKASLSTLRAFAIPPSTTPNGGRGRERYPSAETIADVAKALGVPAAEFPEYRLAKAREELDERVIGIGQALRALEIFSEASQHAALRSLGPEDERPDDNQRQPPASGVGG